MKSKQSVVTVLALSLLACATSHPVEREPAADDAPIAAITSQAESLTFHTEPVSLDPGQERYVCFTATIDEDAVVDSYLHEAQPFVHHIVFVRTLTPEPEGLHDCDTLFSFTWDPLFLSGAGRSSLELPQGAGHQLMRGTQLLAQLHMLNTGEKAVSAPVDIQMHRSSVSDPQPVSAYVFGSTAVQLPARAQSQVRGECALHEPVQLIAAFPHMHQLGRKLEFEAGPAQAGMQPVFSRDPFDFDDQRIDPVTITLNPGDMTRVTCTYDNTSEHTVTFGESTHDEMCFFVGFALGRSELSGCVGP